MDASNKRDDVLAWFKETMKDLNPHYSIYVQYKDTEVDAGFTVQGFDEIKRILTESIS
ncbi:MAG: hypothetical protein LC122_12465 [Chitinophagales bacterium]|nr:hypothetical protein [Chitinophagales bacterium]